MASVYRQPKIELKIRDPVEDVWLEAPLIKIEIDQQRSELPTLRILFVNGSFANLCDRLFAGRKQTHIDLTVDEDRQEGTIIIDIYNLDYEADNFAKRYAVLRFTSLTPYKPKETRKMSKIDNIAIIANDDVTTLKARFTWEDPSKSQSKPPYTFKVMRTLAVLLKPDDFVVVDSTNGISVVKIVSIDEFSDIEIDSDTDYRWAFQKVDQPLLDSLLKQEADIVNKLKTAQRRNIQAGALREMGIDGDLKSLSQATVEPAKAPHQDAPPPQREPFPYVGGGVGEERAPGGVREQE